MRGRRDRDFRLSVIGIVLGLASGCSSGGDHEPNEVMPQRLSPVQVDSGGTVSDDSAWLLFDRDTRAGWSPPIAGETSSARVRVSLGETTAITHLKIFGASPYVLAIHMGNGTPIAGLESVRLGDLGAGWNVLPLAEPLATDAVVLELARAGDGDVSVPGVLGEIELWGTGRPIPVLDAKTIGALVTSGPRPAAPGVDLVPASGGVTVELAPRAQPGDPVCGKLAFALARSPASYRRAWIAYTADGAFRSFVLTRALNTATQRPGQWFNAGDGPAVLVDAIDPATLVRGDNHYHVCLPEDAASAVVLHDAYFVGELDRGSNQATSVARGPLDGMATEIASELLDPANAAPVTVRAGERLLVALDRWIAPDAVLLRRATGTWAVDCIDDGGRATSVAPSDVAATADLTRIALTEGTNELACAAIAIRPIGGAGGSLAGLTVVGSGARTRIDWPTITLASSPEHFGPVAWVDGWASAPSTLGGPVTVTVQASDMETSSGVFGRLLSRAADLDRPWPVTVTARFSDGSQSTRTFVLDRGGALEPKVSVMSAAEKAARYGVPGQATTEIVETRSGTTKIRVGTDVGVDIPEGAVANKVDVTVKHLAAADIPALDPGMVNVTAPDAHAFEFGPHGQQFKKPVDIIVPYDPALLPPGYTSDDVHTYYFDTEVQRWRRLARLSVDGEQRTVRSASDHFTTMIDAVVIAPEHPQVRQFDPNALSGIKAADPGAGIRLIDPPSAGSRGDAAVSYSFDLPPGRRGLAPALALSYSSSRGNGWVGLGWDLPVNAIAVDTRFGAARYDCNVETETYGLDGEQLTPIAHRGPVKQRTDDTTVVDGETVKIFHTRVEGGFRRIIRHGASTQTYWWEVIDKAGTRSFFGGTPESGGPIAGATLRSNRGDIFQWSLVEVRDLHGNAMRYEHESVTSVGFAAGTVPGVTLYPRTIKYTLEPGAQTAPYEVVFLREGRPDVQIDGRGGFKHVTAERLRRVEVRFQGGLVRAWDLAYTEGAFHKSLLASIQLVGASDQPLAGGAHRFEYFDEIRESPTPGSAFKGFASAAPWNVGDDHIRTLNIPGPVRGLLGNGEATVLGGTEGVTGGGHIYIGFNPAAGQKQNSFGGKFGFNVSTSDVQLSLLDVDGDGLPDKLFQGGGGIGYRRNLSGPPGATRFAGAISAVPGLPSLGSSGSTMFSFGAEAYPGPASLIVNVSETFTREDRYFADVNGDGLPDFVEPGTVHFNTPTASGQVFVPNDSGTTPLPIVVGAVDPNGVLPDFGPIAEENARRFPPVDAIRRWIAPYAGTIQITGAARLRPGSPLGDGVRVAIQHNGIELWAESIAPGDFTPKVPVNVSAITVGAGDRLYFRVSGLGDARDHVVDWDPVIAYTGVPALADANLRDERRFEASGDFVLGGRDGMVVNVPFDGVIKLVGTVTKARTTDAVTLEVTQRRTGVSIQNPVFSVTRAATSTVPFVIDRNLPVLAGDQLEIAFRIDSPIDLTAIGFSPASALHWRYVSATDKEGRPVTVIDDAGNALEIPAPFDLDTYGFRAPAVEQPTFVAPESGTLRVFASVDKLAATHVDFTIKKPGELLAKRAFSTSDTVELRVRVTEGDLLYFDFSTREQGLPLFAISTSVRVTFDPDAGTGALVPSLLHFPGPTNRCPRPYRGWSYGGLNGAKVPPGAVIPDAEFCNEESTFDEDTPLPEPGDLDGVRDQGGQVANDTLTFAFVPFPAGRRCPVPDRPCDLPQVPLWGGVDEQLYFLPGSFSASRIGPDDLTVPTPDTVVRGGTVSRLSRATQLAEALGVSVASISNSDGTSRGVVDYLDMNGDSFPDVVGHGAIQYTTPRGTLGSGIGCRAGTAIGTLREGTSKAVSGGIGGTVADHAFNAKGRGAGTGTSPASGAGNSTQMVSLGFSVSGNVSKADSDSDLLDVNGDGLPDRVYSEGGTLMVQLNLGYSFLGAEPFAAAALNTGNSAETTGGANIGFNDGIYGFGGGASASLGTSSLRPVVPGQPEGKTLADINGDGLLDQVLPSEDNLQVGINTGAGFAPAVPWRGVPDNDITRSANVSVGGGAYFTIGIPLCLAACYLIINPGVDFNVSMDRPEVALRDIDGDGFPDHLSSGGSDDLEVASNLTARTNLLRKVSRPLGATFELDYRRVGNTFEQPESQFVLSRVVTFDGVVGDWRASNPGADFQLMTFAYEGGFHDRRERDFRGHARVVTTTHDTRGLVGGVPPDFSKPYVRTTRTYLTDSFFTKGLLVSERFEGLDTGSPRTFAETTQSYALREVDTQRVLEDPAAITETLSSVFPELRRTTTRRSEGNAAEALQTELHQTYDTDGNVIQIIDTGDAGPADDYTATITYTGHGGAHAACATRHIVGLADSIVVRGTGGSVLRRRESSFDCTNANLIELRQTTEGTAVSVSSFQHAGDGNLATVVGAPNLRGQRYTLGLTYDAPTRSHVIAVTDSFGQLSTSDYDLRFGAVTVDTDSNGNAITSTYDDFGRVATIVGPLEAGTGLTTMTFEYHPEQSVPFARTANIDVFRNPGDPIETVIFIDGYQRVLQTKKDATVHQGRSSSAADVMTVSGCIALDQLGRTFETHYPTTEAKSTSINHTFKRSCDTKAPPTRLTLDVLGRPLVTALPDGTSTNRAFAIAPDRQGEKRFASTVIDALGTRSVSFRDIKDHVVAIQQFNAPKGEVIWTEYSYDAVDQLLAVRDDRGNVTRATYDVAGRMRLLDSPDAGKVETIYDAASNVIQKITSNLRASSQAITYDYDFNRLVAISYPSFPDSNVAYLHGGAALRGQPGNLVGRIVKVTDASGSELRSYGKLGELVEETKIVASKTQGTSDNSPEIWTTRYVYDTWGRLQQMTYPDGEVLTYAYDSGGLVRAATGVKLGVTTPYLQRLEYDELGQRTFLLVGNGVESTYSYDARDRRLARLVAGDFQDLRYGYDAVGNITALSNQVPVAAARDLGGPVDQTFGYDGLYRLTQATGEWRFSPNKRNSYALSLAYDTIHNITRKTQSHAVTTPGGSTVSQHKSSYDVGYAYAGERPHAATTIGERAYFYDGNGNQTGYDELTSGQRRTIVWDDENRIRQISDNGRTTRFVYDDAGERVIKRGAQGETAYVNQFWTVRNRSVATKHIFAGDARIASKVIPGDAHVDPGDRDPFVRVLGQWWQHRSEQGWQNGQNLVKNPHYAGNRMPDLLPEDNFVFFYHPDHLGSTSFATAADGDLYEHLQYFPFGETWVAEQTNTQRLPHLFTGKELDEETQLYYFGARYYDPRTSVWQSPDPILGSYVAGRPNGGVYAPANLALYTYTWNNPLVFRDPDGRFLDTIADIAFTAYDIGKLVYDEVQGNTQNRAENLIALGADVAGILVPFATGGGVAVRAGVRAGKAVDHGLDAAKALDKTGDAVKALDKAQDTIKTADRTGDAAKAARGGDLPGDALVCRGGTCAADRFAKGSGVTLDSGGRLQGVSVNSAPGATIEQLTSTIPNKQVGVTTVDKIRAAGGNVIPSPTPNNPFHCTMCGITPAQAEKLFTPTIRNPSIP